MRYIYIFFLNMALIYGCNSKPIDKSSYSNKTIVEGNMLIEGIMSDDTVFNGEISYFRGDTLLERRTFFRGVPNGLDRIYFPNGKISQISRDKYGLTDGELIQFDSAGKYLRKQYYYNGRLMGPQYYYDTLGFPEQYFFLNFENEEVCQLRYYKNKIEVEKGGFIIANSNKLIINGENKVRIFTYVMHPEKILSKYYICLVNDEQASNITTIDSITTKELFYERDFPEEPNKFYALKVDVFDSLEKRNRVFIKIFN
jgi:hypothetical protein